MKSTSSLGIAAVISAITISTTLIHSTTARASSGNPPMPLAWKKKAEKLTYRSCGCADSCWVAELRSKASGKLIVRLTCDCEKLIVARTERPDEKSPIILRNNCDGFGSTDKLEKITNEVERLQSSAP